MISWMKFRWIYFLVSAIMLFSGSYSLIKWGLNLSIDFTGGVNITYQNNDGVVKSEKYATKTSEDAEKIKDDLKSNGNEILNFEVVGPSVGSELIKKTIYALLISATLILFWVAIQFKSIKFGVSAILAMLHDSLVLIGSFSLLGHFLGVEVDFLFVTAALTILSFSVHDTIVVYDRIREKQKKEHGSLREIADHAITETMARSLNNSFTIIFMLYAMVLLGGESVRWFSVALLIGTISGTYSSPFVAVPILVTWDEMEKKIKK